MASLTTFEGDLYVKGQTTLKTVVLPAASVGDTEIKSVPGTGVDADKLEHRYAEKFNQPNTAATSETRFIRAARAAGVVKELVAGSIAIAIGAATVTFDLKKNGTSILTGVLTLNSSSVARIVQSATIATAAYVANDWFELVITATAGGGTLPTGIGGLVVFDEMPS